ncbi:MAG: ATP-binding cassette domain-containing protein, partial [Ignavibacteriaceae bacterium]
MIQINIKSITLFEDAGKRILLRNAAFTMAGQNIYTILGKNGEGKSTLLKSITKLLDETVFSIEGS